MNRYARIAMALLDREVLDAAEIKLLLDNKPLPEKIKPVPPAAPPAVPGTDPRLARPEPRTAPGFAKGEKPAPA